MADVHSLFTFPIHLGLGAKAEAQPEFSGLPWYEDYSKRVAADGREGRLVSMYRFDESWDSWEMHPVGDEVVLCVAGTMTIHQKLASGEERAVMLAAGDYVVNPPGAWHTADVDGEATALFITAGEGTQHRPR